jgi:hypothetical protein
MENIRNACRIKLDSSTPGIACFDLFGAFIGSYLIKGFIAPKFDNQLYYLLVIPIGILVHLLIGQSTFLNRKLFIDADFNIYKIIIAMIVFCISQILKSKFY